MKKIGASKIALWILFIVSAVVLGMFFGVGFGEQDTINGNVYTAPANTSILLIWLYVLVCICAGAVVIFSVINGIKNAIGRDKSEKRKSWLGPVILLTIVVIVASYFMASTTPVRLGDNTLFENVAQLKLVDVCIYTIYFLVLASIGLSALSVTGIFKSKK